MAKLERTGGELSQNLARAAEMEVFTHESAVTPGTIATDIRITRVTVEYEVGRSQALGDRRQRTELDVVRETADAARRTGGCPGIVAPVDDTPPDHSLSGPDDDHWAV